MAYVLGGRKLGVEFELMVGLLPLVLSVSGKEDSSIMNRKHFTTDRGYLKCALLLH